MAGRLEDGGPLLSRGRPPQLRHRLQTPIDILDLEQIGPAMRIRDNTFRRCGLFKRTRQPLTVPAPDRHGTCNSWQSARGGWTIRVDPALITLRDVHAALGSQHLFAMGNRTEAPGCLLEQAVNDALDGAFDEAEALLHARFGMVTLAQLRADFRARMAASGLSFDLETVHAA